LKKPKYRAILKVNEEHNPLVKAAKKRLLEWMLEYDPDKKYVKLRSGTLTNLEFRRYIQPYERYEIRTLLYTINFPDTQKMNKTARMDRSKSDPSICYYLLFSKCHPKDLIKYCEMLEEKYPVICHLNPYVVLDANENVSYYFKLKCIFKMKEYGHRYVAKYIK